MIIIFFIFFLKKFKIKDFLTDYENSAYIQFIDGRGRMKNEVFENLKIL